MSGSGVALACQNRRAGGALRLIFAGLWLLLRLRVAHCLSQHLAELWQIIGYWLGWWGSPGKGRAIGVGAVKFRGHITPDIKRVRYEVNMRLVRRGKLTLGIADAACLPTTHASISPGICGSD